MMLKHVPVVIATVMVVAYGFPTPDPCENLTTERVCNETQYELYRDCIEETKELRKKRQTMCPYALIQQDAPYTASTNWYETDEESLQTTGLPENIVPPIVHVIPAWQNVITVEPVDSNNIPDNDIQSDPIDDDEVVDDEPPQALKSLKRRIIVQGEGDEALEYHVPTNVTTVIRLTNVVNNTNIVNAPTNVNTTNVNNIHIYANLTEGEPEPKPEKCCTAVRPKTCSASTQGVRCQHKKFKLCGPKCTSDVMHVQRKKRCDANGNCQEKISYIPQPEKPVCVYIDQWPFVACGKPANMKVICDGCYDHYGQDLAEFNGGPMPEQCRACYDDGFQYGPMYRRGPVMRPFYSHEPPCQFSGNCPSSYQDWGYPNQAWSQPSPYDPAMDESNTFYYDQAEPTITNDTESDWGIPVHKCTVVSDDNTISVQNCTNTVENQYAAAPASYPYYNSPQFGAKSNTKVYKVKKAAQKKQQVHRLSEDDWYPSSGEDAIQLRQLNSDSAFVVEDDDDYDLSL
ncbi:uncharacterized protein LOC129756520 isoform X2 [Uranotaenia lowii]|nr:uncharacterized protein LOC129756520 isoform X2 [Uranotaenia lowii]